MKFTAYIMEYERGWGSRVDETLKFDTEKERDDYIAEYNAKYNTEKVVPDWYMVATKQNNGSVAERSIAQVLKT